MKNGSMLESFVSYVYSQLLHLNGFNNVIVSKNVKIRDSDNVINEFDVFYEFSHLNLTCKVAIECKDWSSPVSVGEVRNFCRKIESIDFCKIIGVMVSRSGYQTSAIEFARARGIKLLTVKDLPNIVDITTEMIGKAFLPNEDTVGDPFWTLMEISNNQLTGAYISFQERFNEERPTIPLFFSKKMAEMVLTTLPDRYRWCVRGVSQFHLGSLIDIHKLGNSQFAIAPAVWSTPVNYTIIQPTLLKQLYHR